MSGAGAGCAGVQAWRLANEVATSNDIPGDIPGDMPAKMLSYLRMIGAC